MFQYIDKVFIDIGSKYTKFCYGRQDRRRTVLEYGGRLDTSSYFFETSPLDAELIDPVALISELGPWIKSLRLKDRAEVVVSLAPPLTETEITPVFNTSSRQVNAAIKSLRPMARQDHLRIYWEDIGGQVIESQQVRYCLLCAVESELVEILRGAFYGLGLDLVKPVRSPAHNLIKLAEISSWKAEYKNRILLDMGASSMRVVIIQDGVPIYTTEVVIGYNSYIDGLVRVSELEIPEIVDMLDNIGVLRENFDLYKAPKIDRQTYFEVVEDITRKLLLNLHLVVHTYLPDQYAVISHYGHMVLGLNRFLPWSDYTLDDFNPSYLKQGAGYPIELTQPSNFRVSDFGLIGLALDGERKKSGILY